MRQAKNNRSNYCKGIFRALGIRLGSIYTRTLGDGRDVTEMPMVQQKLQITVCPPPCTCSPPSPKPPPLDLYQRETNPPLCWSTPGTSLLLLIWGACLLLATSSYKHGPRSCSGSDFRC